uniref:Uncharacterized protein n=1 Tax=Ascaris lumbricoides TaxID=6252 RepID=A0A0M3IX06_ASCLU
MSKSFSAEVVNQSAERFHSRFLPFVLSVSSHSCIWSPSYF